MAETARPFTTFNFAVDLRVAGLPEPLCQASFSECDGLEMSQEPKTIREGGNNGRQIHLAGPVGYGQLTLKRGMTSTLDLWSWFEAVQANRSLRASCEVRVLPSYQPKRDTADLVFRLTGCLPVKLKAPSLSAKDGQVAIEEMQIAYETLALVPGGG